jgi:hypothetical protein
LAPKLIESKPAKYTAAALKAKVRGQVAVDLVVLDGGTVGDVRISKTRVKQPLQGADGAAARSDVVEALNASAIEAVKAYRYKAGMLSGKPVSVIVTELVEFKIH